MNKLETLRPRPAAVYAILTGMMMVVASSNIIGRAVHEFIPPVGLAFWRAMVPVFVFAPFVVPRLFGIKELLRTHWKLIWLLGILQVVPSAIVLLGLNFTTAINATLLMASQTAATAFLAWLLLRDRVTKLQIFGIVAALAGILVMISRADIAVLLGFGFNRGDVLMLIAVLGWASYNIIVLRLPNAIGLGAIVFLTSFFGALTLLPVYIFESIFIRPVPLTGITFATIGVLGFGVSTIAVFIWNMSLRTIGPHRTNVFSNLIPIFGAVLAIIFLGEKLFLFHLVGALFVMGGISLVIIGGRKRRAAAAEE